MDGIESYGWDARFAALLTALAMPDGVPARVIAEHRDALRVRTAAGEQRAVVAGHLRHAAATGGGLPAVGDWVLLESAAGDGAARIGAVLPRRTQLVRKVAGRRTAEQVLAANVDVLFVATALDADFSPRRIERALAMAWEGSVQPVVLLTKADLCADTEARVAETANLAPGVLVHAIAAPAGLGLDAVRSHLGPGRTSALVGSSGVGKSTLVNALLGEARLAVAAVRSQDSKGRHTTTERHLWMLPGGGMIVDTPGLRELQLWDAETGIDRVFIEIDQMAAACRFRDCRHESEPGCAVRAAVEAGTLDHERLASRHKLGRELEHLDAKRDGALRRARTRRERAGTRAYDRGPARGRDTGKKLGALVALVGGLVSGGGSVAAPPADGGWHPTIPAADSVGAPNDSARARHRFDDVQHWSRVFDDPDRFGWQEPQRVVDLLRLRPGMRVADIGAGTGYFEPYLSRGVGPDGIVFACEVETTLVAHLGRRADADHTPNVRAVLATADDPRIPPGPVDRVLLVDTYHHIDARIDYFRRLRERLDSTSLVAVVDWLPGQLARGPGPEHKIRAEEVMEELRSAGYRVVERTDLRYQFVLLFRPLE